MGRNPKGSPWYSTKQADRVRKITSITLSDAARIRLDELSSAVGMSRSGIVEALILDPGAIRIAQNPESE